MGVEIIKLANGITVVLEKMPYVRSVSFGLWVRCGSRNESETESGVTHFTEHMFFKGTSRRTAKEIAEEMDEIGGQINAYTSKEHTCVYARVLDSHFDVALDVMADIFFDSRFDETDVERERNVILEEISMYEDTPEDLVYDVLYQGIWKNDPLGSPIIGTAETINSFDRDVLINHVKRNFTPGETLLAAAGSFDSDEIIKKIEKYFLRMERSGEASAKKTGTLYTPCISVREKDIEQVHLCVGFPGFPLDSDHVYELSVINAIFGGGMSSRLFQSIREEKGLAYAVYSYSVGFSDTGLFTVYAACGPNQAEEVLNLIIGEIDGLFTNRITDRQLGKTKEQLISGYLLSLESTANRMNAIAKSQLTLGRVLSADELIKKVESVGMEGIYDVLGRIFDMKKISLSAVSCAAGLDFEGAIGRGAV